MLARWLRGCKPCGRARIRTRADRMNNFLGVQEMASYATVIVGGGIQGLCVLRHMRGTALLVERQPALGGVWYAQRESPYASLQVSRGHYRFPDYRPMRHRRASAADVCAYMAAYARDKDLLPHIRLNCSVTSMTVDNEGVLLQCEDGSTLRAATVVCTGTATVPHIPDSVRDPERTVHTAHLTAAALEGARGRRCVVLGGSKSAAEAALQLERHGAHVTWVARQFYSYYETSDPFTMPLSRLFRCMLQRKQPLKTCMHPLRVHADEPLAPGSINGLTPEEHRKLQALTTVKGELDGAQAGLLTLRGGGQHRYDVLVLGTGYDYNPLCPAEGPIITYDVVFPGVHANFGIVGAWMHASATVAFIRSGMHDSYRQFTERYSQRHRTRLVLLQFEYLFLLARRLPPVEQYTPAPLLCVGGLLVVCLLLLCSTCIRKLVGAPAAVHPARARA